MVFVDIIFALTYNQDKGGVRMRKIVDDVRLMTKVCDLYYNQDVSQQQIASLLGLSRPTVSRLLSSARDRGIVQISVSNLNLIKYWEMERKLETMYGLREVLIVDSVEDPEEQKDLLGMAAGQYVENTIRDGNVVGLSMGSTLYQVVAHINHPAAENVTFVPLIGGMGQLRMDLHANNLAETLAYINALPVGGVKLYICAAARAGPGIGGEDTGTVYEGGEPGGGAAFCKEAGHGSGGNRLAI